MSDKLNVFQRINKVRGKIDYLKKDKQVQNYKAITHDQVTGIIRDHLVAFGIVIYPNLISSITLDSGEKTKSGTVIIRVEAVYEFTVVNIDDPTDFFKSSISAHANDTGDKAPGKVLSYAKKAFVLKLFEIETGEDDESRYQKHDTISDVQVKKLEDLINEVKADKDGFLGAFKLSSLSDITVQDLPKAVAALERKRAQTKSTQQ